MSHPTALADGQRTTIARVNGALVQLHCVRFGHAYRAAVCYGSTGAEVPELTRSYPTEQQALAAIRMAVTLLGGGWRIPDLVDAVHLFRPA